MSNTSCCLFLFPVIKYDFGNCYVLFFLKITIVYFLCSHMPPFHLKLKKKIKLRSLLTSHLCFINFKHTAQRITE